MYSKKTMNARVGRPRKCDAIFRDAVSISPQDIGRIMRGPGSASAEACFAQFLTRGVKEGF
jgi:hypothetical protein